METQNSKLNFSGQNIYVGFDVHLKSWKVTDYATNDDGEANLNKIPALTGAFFQQGKIIVRDKVPEKTFLKFQTLEKFMDKIAIVFRHKIISPLV